MSQKKSKLSSLISTWLQSLEKITGKITLWRSFKSEQMPTIPKDFEELTARLAEEVALVSGVENGLLLSKLLRMLQAACWSVEIRENPYNKIPLAHIDRTKLMLSSLSTLGIKARRTKKYEGPGRPPKYTAEFKADLLDRVEKRPNGTTIAGLIDTLITEPKFKKYGKNGLKKAIRCAQRHQNRNP